MLLCLEFLTLWGAEQSTAFQHVPCHNRPAPFAEFLNVFYGSIVIHPLSPPHHRRSRTYPPPSRCALQRRRSDWPKCRTLIPVRHRKYSLFPGLSAPISVRSWRSQERRLKCNWDERRTMEHMRNSTVSVCILVQDQDMALPDKAFHISQSNTGVIWRN